MKMNLKNVCLAAMLSFVAMQANAATIFSENGNNGTIWPEGNGDFGETASDHLNDFPGAPAGSLFDPADNTFLVRFGLDSTNIDSFSFTADQSFSISLRQGPGVGKDLNPVNFTLDPSTAPSIMQNGVGPQALGSPLFGGHVFTAGTYDFYTQGTLLGEDNVMLTELAFTAAVPVPAAVWLFGSGLGLLGWMRRKATV